MALILQRAIHNLRKRRLCEEVEEEVAVVQCGRAQRTAADMLCART
jgi:hypothetical protein